MRKDVKIIMAICVIVLIGLIVYALFLPGEKKSPVASTEGSNDNTSAINTSEDNTASPATQPADNGVAAMPSTQPSDNGMAASPTTAPSEMAMNNAAITPMPAPTAAAPTSGDWNKLLNTGSSTPDVSAGNSNVGGAASASSNFPTNQQIAESATGGNPMSSGSAPSPVGISSSGSSIGAESTSRTGERTYIVKAGDTPSSIAQAEYGNRSLYTKILAANPNLNARHMHVGQKIILPDLSASASGNTSSSARNGTSLALGTESGSGVGNGITAHERNSTASETSTSATGSKYTVVTGDSLQKISIKLYGSSGQWQKIYALNKSKIGSNPRHLRAGMVLILPKAASSQHERSAAPAAGTSDITPLTNNTSNSDMTGTGTTSETGNVTQNVAR